MIQFRAMRHHQKSLPVPPGFCGNQRATLSPKINTNRVRTSTETESQYNARRLSAQDLRALNVLNVLRRVSLWHLSSGLRQLLVLRGGGVTVEGFASEHGVEDVAASSGEADAMPRSLS
jgi:hypothetical protein